MERSPEDQIRDKLEGHMGYQVSEVLQGKYSTGSTISKDPLDGNVGTRQFDLDKRNIENKAAAERAENLSHLMLDVVDYRKVELLDKEAMPMHKLIDLTIKTLPKQVQMEVKTDVGFMSLYDQIDVEGEVVD